MAKNKSILSPSVHMQYVYSQVDSVLDLCLLSGFITSEHQHYQSDCSGCNKALSVRRNALNAGGLSCDFWYKGVVFVGVF